MKMKSILKLLLVALFAASIILMVSCSTSTYFVNFDSDGGSAVDSVEVKHGNKLGTAPTTTKEGYTFDGWYDNNDKWDFEHYAITKNITLKAKWIKNHTVSFNSDGGTAVDSITVIDGTKAIAPSNPIKGDSEFLGWFKGEAKWNFAENVVTEDITLTAKWHDNYTVKFNPDGSSYIAHQRIKAGALATKPADPVRNGYEFAGWYAFDEATGAFKSDTVWSFDTPITADTTLKAKWTPIFTVSFSTDGAGKIDSIKLLQGSLIPAPAALNKDGYKFEGWFVGETPWDFENATVTGDITLVAKWTAIKYTVTIDSNTGAEGEQPATLEVFQGDAIPVPETPTLDGYAFIGWYEFNPEDETVSATPWSFETTAVLKDVTIKAMWIKTWTASFFVDGTLFSSCVLNEGSLITAPQTNPEKDGTVFQGWYLGATPFNFETTPITSDITLTAVFITKHTVKFDLDGGLSNTITDVTLLFGETVARPADPEKPDYVFNGWYFGDALWNFDTPISADITLTAKWLQLFDVKFDDRDDNTVDVSITVVAGQKIPLDIVPIPTKEHYRFAYWQTENKVAWDFENGVVTGDMILYPQWTDNYWVITFNSNGAAEIPSVTINRGELVPVPTDPEREDRGFVCWAYEGSGTPFDFTKAPVGDTALIAVWTEDFHTIKFINKYSNGDTEVVKIQRIPHNSFAKIPNIELNVPDIYKPENERERYEFLGWNWDFTTEITADIDLYANWCRVLRVSFNISETDNDDFVDVLEGRPIGFYLDPKKPNHIFMGWLYNGQPWNIETQPVTENMTLTPDWREGASVRYDLNGGWMEDQNFEGFEIVEIVSGVETKFTNPGTPKKNKFIFGGWIVDGSNKIWNFETDIAEGEVFLHALWIPIYYVNFDVNGGAESYDRQDITSGAVATRPAENPTKQYMSFEGWYLNGALYDFSSAVTGDITLVAKWAPRKYTVTFDANGGVGGYSQEFEAGKTLSVPTTISRDGYVIKEWKLSNGITWNFATDILESDITIKPVWTNENITVRFDLNGASSADGTPSVLPQTVVYGSLLTSFADPYMTDSEYIFKGWFRPDGTKWNFATDVATENITLIAVFETDYRVTFETDDGIYEEKRVTGGDFMIPPLVTPKKLGYKFLGWFNGQTKWDFNTMRVTEDLVLVAKWEMLEYTVSFVTRVPGEEDLKVLGTVTVNYGDFITCPETPFIGEAYIFDSWRTTNGKVWNFNVDTITADTVIQAYWVTPGTGTGGGVIGPWDEGAGTTQGPIHDFS